MEQKFFLSISGCILFILVSINYFSPTENDLDQIYGIWEGIFNDKKIVIELNQDQTCTLTIRDLKTESIKRISGMFVFDTSKNPMPLTIRDIPSLNHPLHTIVEFADNDRIRMAKFSKRWRLRSVSFEADNSFALNRVH